MDRNTKVINKDDIAKEISELGLSYSYARRVVDYFFKLIAEDLIKGEIVHLVGFGSFRYQDRPGRKGRNPRTGGTVQVPAKRVVRFQPSIRLKQLVRQSFLASQKESSNNIE